MAFHVGQKVVCIRRDPWVVLNGPVRYPGIPKPKYGEVVSIAAIKEALHGTCLCLTEYEPDKQRFVAVNFRLLQEQGMSILRAILADPKVKIKETA